MRKGAWALFHGIPTHNVKDIEFLSFYEFKNEFTFILVVAMAQGTLVHTLG